MFASDPAAHHKKIHRTLKQQFLAAVNFNLHSNTINVVHVMMAQAATHEDQPQYYCHRGEIYYSGLHV